MIVHFFDESGKPLVISSINFEEQLETETGYILPGEVAYFTAYSELAEENHGKLGKVEMDVNRDSFFKHYYELEAPKDKLFEVNQGGDVTKEESMVFLYADVTPTEAFKSFYQTYEPESVETYALFMNDKDEVLAAASNSTTISDATSPIHEHIQCLVHSMPEYSKIALVAHPHPNIDTMTPIEFSKKN